MRVLVGHASAHGSTRSVAEAIGERLREAGHEVDVRPVAEVDTVDVDAVVLGSAVHDGTWLDPAVAFARQHAAALAQRPVWLFSVSSVGDTSSVFRPRVAAFMRRLRREPKGINQLRAALGARDHRNFAGVVRSEHWGRAGTLFLRALGGRYGDHRDWTDIDAWAAGIAAQLLGGQRPQGTRPLER